MTGAVLGEVQVSLFVAGALLGEVQVSLFVAGAVLGDVQVALFVAGAVLGEVVVSLFVAGAVFGESLTVRLGCKTLYFTIEKCFWGPRKVTSLARRVAVCVFILGSLLGSCSDHGRIGPALEMTFHAVGFGDFSLTSCSVIFSSAGAVFGEVG